MKQNIEPVKIPNASKYTRPSPEVVKRLKYLTNGTLVVNVFAFGYAAYYFSSIFMGLLMIPFLLLMIFANISSGK